MEDEVTNGDLATRDRELIRRELELLRRETELLKREVTSKVYSMRDIEDSLPTYAGDSIYPVEKWLQSIEENSELLKLTEMQKLLYSKKLLRGTAKLWLDSQPVIKTWKLFVSAITEEFGRRLNSAEIHNQLIKRKKKVDESYQDYILIMTNIGRQGSLEDEAIIQYITDGIQDSEVNKTVLYTAKTLQELKVNMEIYTRMKKNTKTYESKVTNRRTDTEKSERCYNCGKNGHKSKDCRFKEKGTKCFACNAFGHVAARCPDTQANRRKDSLQVTKPEQDRMKKDIRIEGMVVNALIDTGSCVNLIRSDEYFRIGAPKVTREIEHLTGLGQTEVKTLGYFDTTLKVDECQFSAKFHVVDNTAMRTKCIIGNELMKQAIVTIGPEGMTIKKAEEPNPILQINCIQDERNRILQNCHNPKYSSKIEEIIKNYNPKPMKTPSVVTKIIMKDETPIAQAPRRLSPREKLEVDTQIQEWLDKGIIRPSTSEFSSPLVLVKKKNGNTRICIDFRKLNKQVVRDRYPLPLIEDQIDKLQEARVFSSIDLRNGFFHVAVDPASRKYTGFVTPDGHYEFVRTPFGFCNSPASFQRYINSVFRELVRRKIVAIYMDDVVILAENEEEALQRLILVLETAEEHGLEINWEKCQFLSRKIVYLGYEIEEGKIRPNEEKTRAIVKFPEPRNVKQIQSFLGLSGYFRKFIKNYSTIAKPLSDLLKADRNFRFEAEEKQAFQKLKECLAEQPVLAIYHPDLETEVHTDASKHGLGAVLLQRSEEDRKFHPVFYYSKKTSDAEQRYTSYELEVLAAIAALKKFRIYLLGIKFKIVTDCSAFKMTMSKKELSTRIARWALLLEDFEYTIEHRPGQRMKHADALSRNPVLIITEDGLIPRIRRAQEKDEELQETMNRAKDKKDNNFFMKNGLLYRYQDGDDLLVIPKSMQTEIIKRVHEVGHFGITKTKEMIAKDYWIPKLENKIRNVIANCVPCILSNAKAGKQECFLNPIDKNEGPLHTYHVDHLGPLPSSNKNYKYLFVVTDGFTKFTWIFPTKTTTTQEVIVKLEVLQQTFGNPKRIVSDRGTAFTSQDFKKYCEKEAITHLLITTGVPRGNGQVERVHQIIIGVLTKLSIGDPQSWYKHVNRVQNFINGTYQRSINTTPFELMIGTRIRQKEDLQLKELVEQENIITFQEEREEARLHAKQHISKIQEENRKNFNKRRKEARRYQVGDLVAIKRTQFGPGLKIYPKYLGPYRVSMTKSHDRYCVERAEKGEGPNNTTCSADYMKPWCTDPASGEETQEEDTDIEQALSEAETEQEGRVVGCPMPADTGQTMRRAAQKQQEGGERVITRRVKKTQQDC